MDKQEAIDIINEFIWWFTEHKLDFGDELLERCIKFINSSEGVYEN